MAVLSPHIPSNIINIFLFNGPIFQICSGKSNSSAYKCGSLWATICCLDSGKLFFFFSPPRKHLWSKHTFTMRFPLHIPLPGLKTPCTEWSETLQPPAFNTSRYLRVPSHQTLSITANCMIVCYTCGYNIKADLVQDHLKKKKKKWN